MNSTVPMLRTIWPITGPKDVMESRLIIIRLDTPTGSIAVGSVEPDLLDTCPDKATEPMNMYRKETFGYLSVWAYGFPLGLFATSTIKLEAVTKIVFLGYIFLFIWIVLILLWFYALLNTYIFVHRMDRNMKKPSPSK